MLPHQDATGLAPNEKRPTLLQISPGLNLSWPIEDRNISYFIPPETWWPWCDYWKEPQHLIYHLANLCFLIGYASKTTANGALFMHVSVIVGLMLFCGWAWNVICAPDVFTWSFSFIFLNIGQIFYIIFRLRPVKFDPELEEIYQTLFAPFKISRLLFKRMVSSEFAQVMSLHAGEAYAMQNLTRTDRLGILLSGKVNVLSDQQFLHPILPCEFLDSPEFESSRATIDDKFNVSVVAASTCRYLYWQRTALEYLLVKETYLATVLSTLIARDITTKLYAMNNKIVTEKGSHLDIRLPSITSSLTSGGEFGKSPSKNKKLMAAIGGPISPDSLLSNSSRDRLYDAELGGRRRGGENGLRPSEMTPLTELPSCDELADVQHWLDSNSKYHSCEYVDLD